MNKVSFPELVAAGRFKAACLSLTGPVRPERAQRLSASVTFLGDIVEPIGEPWHVERRSDVDGSRKLTAKGTRSAGKSMKVPPAQ